MENKKIKNNSFKVTLAKNILINNEDITCNSSILKCFIAPYSATVVELLEDSKISYETNSADKDEFGIESILDRKIIPNIEGNEESIDISLDYSGTPRIYAAYNGKYSFKPTYGTFSRYGVAAVANSFEQLAITGDKLEKIYELSNILAKKDERDQNSIINDNFSKSFESLENKDLKIGIPKEVFSLIQNDDISQQFIELIKALKGRGIEISEIDTDLFENSLKTFIILSNVEISSNMSRYDSLVYGYRTEEYETIDEMYKKSRQEGLGLDIKNRIILGNFLISEEQREKYYDIALDVRKSIGAELDNILNDCDLILIPTVPYSESQISAKENLIDLFYNEIFTSIGNLSGNPILQIPISKGYGIQLIAKNLKDEDLFLGSKLIEGNNYEY